MVAVAVLVDCLLFLVCGFVRCCVTCVWYGFVGFCFLLLWIGDFVLDFLCVSVWVLRLAVRVGGVALTVGF